MKARKPEGRIGSERWSRGVRQLTLPVEVLLLMVEAARLLHPLG